MKYSNITLFYPVNRALERAIADSIGLLKETSAEAAAPDNLGTVADNFLFTRGNYEQRRFNSSVLQPLREALEATVTDEQRRQDPLAWAGGRNNLGNILAALGQQQSDAELFDMAIRCFNHALEEYDQETSPREWAATQSNLGTALQALGRQESDSKAFTKSVDAYTNALLVWSRKDTPEEWASAMHQLGATLHAHGKLLKGNRNLEKSVVAYKNALAVLDADNYPYELAAAHNNCGAVRHHLAEAEENPDKLRAAIQSYETALTVCLEQQLPVHLAAHCKVNRSTARGVLAGLTEDKLLADEVADEFEVILECFPHALQPLRAKHCQEQMNSMRDMAQTPAIQEKQ